MQRLENIPRKKKGDSGAVGKVDWVCKNRGMFTGFTLLEAAMRDDEEQLIEIDFSRKETEAGWIRILDNLGKHATPVWFNWLTWILIIGAFQYLFHRSRSIALVLVLGISVGLLWLYLQAFFYRLRFKNLLILRRWDRSRLPSLIVSGLLALGSWQLAVWIATMVARNQ